MYYVCSGNKGADQVHIYCAADLHLCVHKCVKEVFTLCGPYNVLRPDLLGPTQFATMIQTLPIHASGMFWYTCGSKIDNFLQRKNEDILFF